MVIVSAQQLLATRICAAERCERDAENHSRLCHRCAHLDSVVMHTNPPPATEPLLRCCTCGEWKPDEDFSRQASRKAAHRRGRCGECKPCTNTRRRAERERNRVPLTRCTATNHGRPTQGGGQQCRNYARLGTAYCPAHTPKAPS